MNFEDYPEFDDEFDEDLDEPATDGPWQDKTVACDHWNGIACRVVTDDGARWATVVMIGDDRRRTVDRDTLRELARRDYCGECGQVGCGCDGLDRSDDE